MGRYYRGDISGKFWFAIQDSLDAENFGVKPEFQPTFVPCGCTVEHLENENLIYCKNCYGSYEDHLREYQEYSDDFETKKLYNDQNKHEAIFSFDQTHKKLLIEILSSLEKKYGEYITEYVIDENGGEITYEVKYDIDLKTEIDQDKITNIARICLGRQILYCLKKYKQCQFKAEL